jgi:addiction module HigA family antidote
MSIPNTGPRKIRPTHPGEMLRDDFLPDYGLTISGLAEALGVSRQTINELLRARRALSPEMALRLSRLFGNSAEFWLNAQRAVDLWDAARTLRTKIRRIKPLRVALAPLVAIERSGRSRSDPPRRRTASVRPDQAVGTGEAAR